MPPRLCRWWQHKEGPQAGLSAASQGREGVGCASTCDDDGGRPVCSWGVGWGECRPEEEPGRRPAGGVSGVWEEGEGSSDMGAGGMCRAREGGSRTFPSDGFKVFPGCSPYLDENTEKHCSLVGHTGQGLCIFQDALWAQRPLLLAQQPQLTPLPRPLLRVRGC